MKKSVEAKKQSEEMERSLSERVLEVDRSSKRKRRVPFSSVVAVFMGIVALGLLLYPSASQWWNSFLHARAIAELNEVASVGPEAKLEKARESARDYNRRLVSSGDNSGYLSELNSSNDGIMGRIKIPSINVDLPIFHTSSDEVLRKGAGHMEETTLPVGGESTHAAITAHRGLAESTLFTNLDKVEVGDQFVLEVSGEVFVYEVRSTRIVKPDETEWLAISPGEDLVTLITCDPLGINTERILVTGERVTPVPVEVLEESNMPSDQPGFPWWAVIFVGGTALIIFGVNFAFRPKRQKR